MLETMQARNTEAPVSFGGRVFHPSEIRRCGRLQAAWWILTGRWSLHVAWQLGYDQHSIDDSVRRARSWTERADAH